MLKAYQEYNETTTEFGIGKVNLICLLYVIQGKLQYDFYITVIITFSVFCVNY